jgi:20S proteasome subunit alpha 7
LGVRCRDGVILAVEKLLSSKLLVAGSGRKVARVDDHIAVAVAGLAADARALINLAVEEARSYRANFGAPIPPRTLAERLGGMMHAYTCYWYLRPFGASILVAGADPDAAAMGTPVPVELWLAEPSGDVARYFGAAAGKGARVARTEIEKGRFADKTVAEALPSVLKILHSVHDAAKDKPFEPEVVWVTAASGWAASRVPQAAVDAASAEARAALAAEAAALDGAGGGGGGGANNNGGAAAAARDGDGDVRM